MDHPILGKVLNPQEIQLLSPNCSKEDLVDRLNEIILRCNALLKSYSQYDPDTQRVYVGPQTDGWGAGKSYGIKVSKEGVDVMTAADVDLIVKLPA